MHTENSIMMKASRARIFEVAADLSAWPKILPHYRWVRYLNQSDHNSLVVMAAKRGWIPIKWTSIQEIDRERGEIRFHHVKAFTRGMDVVWTFEERDGGVNVRITHDMPPRNNGESFFKRAVIGKYFISHVADLTLHHMKAYVENEE
jgi:ribosome-associated toxin RatA of RatAB toxin-antitoxin module